MPGIGEKSCRQEKIIARASSEARSIFNKVENYFSKGSIMKMYEYKEPAVG